MSKILIFDAVTGKSSYKTIKDKPNENLELIRASKLSMAKMMLQGKLSSTDYHILKASEPLSSYAVPDDIVLQRKNYRQLWDTFEAAINKCTTVADLDLLNFNLE